MQTGENSGDKNVRALEHPWRRIVNDGVSVVVVSWFVRLLPRVVGSEIAFLLKLAASFAVRFERRPTHVGQQLKFRRNVATSR